MMPWKVPKASTVGCPISRTVTYYAVHLNNIISTFDWWLSTWLTQKQLKGNVVAGNRIRIKKMNSQFALMIRLNSKNISLEFGYIELVTKCYSSNEKFFFFFFYNEIKCKKRRQEYALTMDLEIILHYRREGEIDQESRSTLSLRIWKFYKI